MFKNKGQVDTLVIFLLLLSFILSDTIGRDFPFDKLAQIFTFQNQILSSLPAQARGVSSPCTRGDALVSLDLVNNKIIISDNDGIVSVVLLIWRPWLPSYQKWEYKYYRYVSHTNPKGSKYIEIPNPTNYEAVAVSLTNWCGATEALDRIDKNGNIVRLFPVSPSQQ